MGKRNLVILSVALLLLLAGSASAAVDFPASEAGISAYVKAKASIDLNTSKTAFASIERETADYIIGTVALTWHTEEQYPHVYVSKDGWIVAYYPKDRSSGWLMPWADYAGGPISSTTLSKAIGIVATAVGGTTTGIKYYDFRYPDASKMMFIMESTAGTEFFKIIIPTTFSIYAIDWSHFSSTGNCGLSTSGVSYVYLNGANFNSNGCGTVYSYGSLSGQLNYGIEHEIKIFARYGTGRIGLVLEYAE